MLDLRPVHRPRLRNRVAAVYQQTTKPTTGQAWILAKLGLAAPPRILPGIRPAPEQPSRAGPWITAGMFILVEMQPNSHCGVRCTLHGRAGRATSCKVARAATML